MAGEFSFDFNRATIIVRHGIWSGLSNSVLNMLILGIKHAAIRRKSALISFRMPSERMLKNGGGDDDDMMGASASDPRQRVLLAESCASAPTASHGGEKRLASVING